MGLKFSDIEKKELLKAWAAISLAFAILLSGIGLVRAIIISVVTVGAGFLLHELAHKLVAQRFGCWAEFRSDDKMLLFAVLSAFLGFIFAAPGAVYIRGNITRKKNGLIAAAGPVTNIVLAGVFFLLIPFHSGLGRYGAMINSFLALFNMIPFMGLDGQKVLAWSKPAYGAVTGLAFLSYIIFSGF